MPAFLGHVFNIHLLAKWPITYVRQCVGCDRVDTGYDVVVVRCFSGGAVAGWGVGSNLVCANRSNPTSLLRGTSDRDCPANGRSIRIPMFDLQWPAAVCPSMNMVRRSRCVTH